ncbi:PepSY domain-containing protein [Acetobacter suratthaniensis]
MPRQGMVWRKKCLRALYLSHRWLGVSMGVLMLSWCLSGMVMLWRPWPSPAPEAAQAGHRPLRLPSTLPGINALTGPERFQSFRLSMVGAEPTLTLFPINGVPFAVDLRTGVRGNIATQDTSKRAQAYATITGVHSPPVFDGITTDDQWVLDTPARLEGFQRFRFSGPEQLVVYVSPVTGDIVQATDRTSRGWAWVGAIPHWLYPAVLRRHPPVWKTVVIILSGTGVFLTGTGLLVGFLCLRRRWPFSAYRRWHLFHHLFGMLFGMLALVWITTGFLTMTPAGLFESSKAALNPVQVTGSVSGLDILAVLQRMTACNTNDWTDVRGAFLSGHIFLATTAQDGHRDRLDKDLTPLPLHPSMLGHSARFLTTPDSYYFNRTTHLRHFPVIRLSHDNGVLFYIDAQTGEELAAFDRAARQSRWFVYGLHDMNFLPWLRTPAARLWGIFPLLCGVSMLFLSGMIIGVRRAFLLWRKTRTHS